MAFKNLTSLTMIQYQDLGAAFGRNPTLSMEGTPDNRVNFSLKGWTGTSVAPSTKLAFEIEGITGATYTVDVDPNNIRTLRVSLDGSNTSGLTYWTIDVSEDMSPTSEWSISFNVVASNRSTGKWVFRKGSSDPNF